jgi:hypothetical protein
LLTVILGVVTPVFHRYELPGADVKVTELPWQKESGPLVVGVATMLEFPSNQPSILPKIEFLSVAPVPVVPNASILKPTKATFQLGPEFNIAAELSLAYFKKVFALGAVPETDNCSG